MYKYRIYGLIFDSDYQIYNFPEVEGSADVKIKKLEQGYTDDEIRKIGKIYTEIPGGIWYLSDIGQAFVTGGNEICLCIYEGVPQNNISMFICGWCMAFLFSQRGYSAFHCTALEVGEECIFVSGVSGAGKSTTALELIRRGYRYLADDIAMINPLGDFMVEPAFPMQKVCEDVADRLHLDKRDCINDEKVKFAYYNEQDFCDKPRPVKAFYVLQKGPVKQVELVEILGVRKLYMLMEGLFLTLIYAYKGIPTEEKFRCLKLAEQVRVFLVTRPEEGDTVGTVCDKIVGSM